MSPAKAISVVKNLNELVILGNNGKIIDLENLPKMFLKLLELMILKKIFQTLKLLINQILILKI